MFLLGSCFNYLNYSSLLSKSSFFFLSFVWSFSKSSITDSLWAFFLCYLMAHPLKKKICHEAKAASWHQYRVQRLVNKTTIKIQKDVPQSESEWWLCLSSIKVQMAVGGVIHDVLGVRGGSVHVNEISHLLPETIWKSSIHALALGIVKNVSLHSTHVNEFMVCAKMRNMET